MDEEKVENGKMMLWLVIAGATNCSPESARAFFNEENARCTAGQLAGIDGGWVNIKSIEIEDRPR